MSYTQDPKTIVKMNTHLWTDEVGIAEAEEVIKLFDPAYKFSNGKEFVVKTHYEPDA